MRVTTETQMNQSTPNLMTKTDAIHTPEENARLLMDIFVHHFKLLTGESLLASKLSGVWYDKLKSQEDMLSGIEYAKMQEWLIPLDEAFRLTEAGYAMASKHPYDPQG